MQALISEGVLDVVLWDALPHRVSSDGHANSKHEAYAHQILIYNHAALALWLSGSLIVVAGDERAHCLDHLPGGARPNGQRPCLSATRPTRPARRPVPGARGFWSCTQGTPSSIQSLFVSSI